MGYAHGMAIQFARMHIIGMSDGKTAVGSSAYMSGTKQLDETTGEIHDRRSVGRGAADNIATDRGASGRADGATATDASEYITGTGQHAKPGKGAERVAYTEVLLPKGADEAYRENSKLWNALQAFEFTRVEAAGNLANHLRDKLQFAGHLILALPRDAAMSEAAHIAMTREFANKHFVNKGHAVEVALHYDNMENPHAHLLVSIRTLQRDGSWNPNKTRNFGGVTFRGVQGQGPRIAEKNPWGALWRDYQNDYFRAHGIDLKVDPTQAIPGVHLGPGAQIPDSRLAAENAERFGESYRLLTLNPDLVLQALTESQSTFSRKDVAKYLSKNGFEGDEFQAAFARVMTTPDVQQLHDPVMLKAQDLYTTEEIRTYEERFIGAVESLSKQQTHGVDPERVRKLAISQGLGPDQIDGAIHIASPGAFKQEQGRAGTGKTTMVRTAIAVQKEAGYNVIGVAPTNAAAKELGKAAGIQARSIDSLLYRLSMAQDAAIPLTDKTILYVDEAGLVDSRRLAKLVHLVEEAGAKIILLGDERQFPAINAGAPFAHTTSHYQTHALETIRRQEQLWDREASSASARGDFQTALSLHDDHGRVHIMKNAAEAKDALIADWLADRDRGLTQFIFAYSKYSATELAYMAREELKAAGVVGESQYLQSDFSAETPMYGDRFVFSNGVAGAVQELRFDPDNNTSSIVLKMDGGQNVEFATEELALANAYRAISVNDEVVMRETDHTLGVTGGMIGRITAIDGTKMMIDFGSTDTPDLRAIDTSEYAAWDRGYAGTLLRGQGASIDLTYLYHTPTWDAAAGYVGMTRHRKNMGIYANGRVTETVEIMAEQMSQQRAKHFTLPHITYAEAQARKGVYDQVSQEIRDAAKVVGAKEMDVAKAFAGFLESSTQRDRARFKVHFNTGVGIDPSRIADPVKRAQAEHRQAKRTLRHALRSVERNAESVTRAQDRFARTAGAARQRARATVKNTVVGMAKWADRTAHVTGGLGAYTRRTTMAFRRPGIAITSAIARRIVPPDAWFIYSSAMAVFRAARTVSRLAVITNRAMNARHVAAERVASSATVQSAAQAAATVERAAVDRLRDAQREAAARAAARLNEAAMKPNAPSITSGSPDWQPPANRYHDGGWSLRLAADGQQGNTATAELRAFLEADKVPYRVGPDGAFTISVGDRANAERLAAELHASFHQHLAAPDAVTASTHRPFAGNVWAAFGIAGDPATLPVEARIFGSEQRHGVPAITRFAEAGDHSLDAYRQADRILGDAFGEYYTGSGRTADKHAAHLINLAAKETTGGSVDASIAPPSPNATSAAPRPSAPEAQPDPLGPLSSRPLDVAAMQIPDHITPTERDVLGRDLTPSSIRAVVASDSEVQADRRRILAELSEVYRDPETAARRLTGLVERAGLEEAARGLRNDPTVLGALLRDRPTPDAPLPVRAAFQRLETRARNIADATVLAGGREHKVANRYIAAVRHRIDMDKTPLPELSKEAAQLVNAMENAKSKTERTAQFTAAAPGVRKELTDYLDAVRKRLGKDAP
jgi:Ti-type conjugative transfer relaxase TraA